MTKVRQWLWWPHWRHAVQGIELGPAPVRDSSLSMTLEQIEVSALSFFALLVMLWEEEHINKKII